MLNQADIECPYCNHKTTIIIQNVDEQVYECEKCKNMFSASSIILVTKEEDLEIRDKNLNTITKAGINVYTVL